MAPSRRKSKAALAAAARLQWKVGDLVLAKLKGFPPWPATVSEPEKWGYSTDWKKVLVYFFGTNQIAFCNPADVEAFTEEKKESLLIKRQGKGADFVRAVKEIIESYEKLKKQIQVDDLNSGVEVLTNAGNSVDSVAGPGMKDYTEASSGTFNSQLDSSDSTRDSDEASPTAQDVLTTTDVDALHDAEGPSDNVTISESTLESTNTSRKKTGGIRLEPLACMTQGRASVNQRSRSSLKLDSCTSQIIALPPHDSHLSVGIVIPNVLHDRCSRQGESIRKSPYTSELNNIGSPAFVSGSVEDNGSEVAMLDTDTPSLNEGSILETGCAIESTGTLKCLEGEVQLSGRLDLQIKAVVVKKKRKPNRKRGTNDAAELPTALDKSADLLEGMHRNRLSSPSACEKSRERYCKEDGDEHLPLVKRARVRMSKLLDMDEQPDSFMKVEDISTKESITNEQVRTSLNSDDGGPAEGHQILVKDSAVDSLPSNNCVLVPDNNPQLLKASNNQQCGTLDGEAILPPSKRLHRALKAMSANVAEDSQPCAESLVPKSSSVDGCCVSSLAECPNMFMERKTSNVKLQNIVSAAAEENTSASRDLMVPQVSGELKMSATNMVIYDQSGGSFQLIKDKVRVAETTIDGSRISYLSPDLRKMQDTSRINKDSPDQSPEFEGKSEDMGLSQNRVEYSNKVHVLKPTKLMTSLSGTNRASKACCGNSTEVHLYSEEKSNAQIKLLDPAQDNKIQVNGMCEFLKEVECETSQISEMTMVDVEGIHNLSHCTQLGSSLNNEKDFTSQASLSRSSPTAIVHIISLQNSGSCSPAVHLLRDKDLSVVDAERGKTDSVVATGGRLTNSAEGRAALTSFGNVLGTLTRTKDSIGRATRLAMDCAKFGLAVKVVDILSRNLENEPSLHRRVDFFFLVDSILQWSRGLKGEFGSLYPSAIQAVLSRLLSAAAPSGNTALENRRQCLKVLKLWLDRRILSESVIRPHMRNLEIPSSSSGPFSRRSSRTERAFDDPLREVEGMLVDEYGSNSSFQLPGFSISRMLKDEDGGSDTDGGNFEAVTPEHGTNAPEERESTPIVERHRHILENVDGELEMEDVAPPCEVELIHTINDSGIDPAPAAHHEQHFPSAFHPSLPNEMPPSCLPLPVSPLPLRLPPPQPSQTLLPETGVPDPLTNAVDPMPCNPQDDLLQSTVQQAMTQASKPAFVDALHYPTPEHQDFQRQMGTSDSSNNCSINNFPTSHPPIRPVYNVPETDDATLHHKGYHIRPPHPAVSDQFTYNQLDPHIQSWREPGPPSYSNRYQCEPFIDGGNFYAEPDIMNGFPHESRESWRYQGLPFSGPRHPGKFRAPFGRGPYMGPPVEPMRFSNQRWDLPPREMHWRNHLPIRPFSEAPRLWRHAERFA